jgi:hypothetical protein
MIPLKTPFLLAFLLAGQSALAVHFPPPTLSPVKTIWDAYADFSSNNDNGPWHYYSRPIGGSLTLLTTYVNCGDQFNCWYMDFNHQLPYIGKYRSNYSFENDCCTQPAGVLDIHPGPEIQAVLGFTAPLSGEYVVWVRFQALDHTPTGVAVQYDNGEDEPNTNPMYLEHFADTAFARDAIHLSEKQSVFFIVSPNGSSDHDTTSLSAQIYLIGADAL